LAAGRPSPRRARSSAALPLSVRPMGGGSISLRGFNATCRRLFSSRVMTPGLCAHPPALLTRGASSWAEVRACATDVASHPTKPETHATPPPSTNAVITETNSRIVRFNPCSLLGRAGVYTFLPPPLSRNEGNIPLDLHGRIHQMAYLRNSYGERRHCYRSIHRANYSDDQKR